MEIFGFILMVTGTSIYNNVMDIGDKIIEKIRLTKNESGDKEEEKEI